MTKINITATLLTWHLHVNLLNEAKSRVEQSRIVTNAKTSKRKGQTHLHCPGFINVNVIVFGEWLINESINAIRASLRPNSIGLDELWHNSGEIPSLIIHNDEFGKIWKMAPCTILSHLRLLESPEISLIIKYKFHRITSNFEVWINPAFLLPELVKSPDQTPQSPISKDPVNNKKGTILPVNIVNNIIEETENSVFLWL